MLAKFTMKLKPTKEISYNMSSLFQGVIMELLPKDYAEFLHISMLKPYAIHLEKENDIWFLIVTTMNEEAYIKIIENALLKIDKLYIRHNDNLIYIEETNIYKQLKKNIAKAFYNTETNKIIEIRFVTPTAFKSQGDYVFFPEIRLIYQSLMNKYDINSDGSYLFDLDILDKLCTASKIVSYNIKSRYFHLEGTKIPSFIGTVKIKISANQTMTNFINMLFEYGLYSGVGVKCSLGMGAIKLITGGIDIE